MNELDLLIGHSSINQSLRFVVSLIQLETLTYRRDSHPVHLFDIRRLLAIFIHARVDVCFNVRIPIRAATVGATQFDSAFHSVITLRILQLLFAISL